ncbi:MAG: GNAT family N-acetyltransferase [Roseiflexaceae bacterium]
MSETTMQIALLPAAATDQSALANLIQFYEYDLSELDGADVDEHGRFSHARIDSCRAEVDCHPFLIQADSLLTGFALIKRRSLLHTPAEGHTVTDFFVLRRFRRQGLGRAAAMALFDRFPGPWEVASCARNVPAHVFWRSVIDRYTAGRYAETWFQTPVWHGPVHSFIAPTPAQSPYPKPLTPLVPMCADRPIDSTDLDVGG